MLHLNYVHYAMNIIEKYDNQLQAMKCNASTSLASDRTMEEAFINSFIINEM